MIPLENAEEMQLCVNECDRDYFTKMRSIKHEAFACIYM